MLRALTERLDELDAIHLRHPKVQHDRVEGLQGPVQELESVAPVLRLHQVMQRGREGQPSDAPDQGGILDDEESHGNENLDI